MIISELVIVNDLNRNSFIFVTLIIALHVYQYNGQVIPSF
jgi:hypothetical protein